MADYIRFYSPYIQDIGLYHGQTGLLLALHLYEQINSSNFYKETTRWLLESIMNNLHDRLPVGMERGLTGIGFGIALLHRFGIMDEDLNEVLADVDQRIMSFDPRRIDNTSFRTGLGGIAAYVQLRQHCGDVHSLDTQYLQELSERCISLSITLPRDPWQMLLHDLTPPTFSATSFEQQPITLCGGASYYLLKSYDTLLSHQ